MGNFMTSVAKSPCLQGFWTEHVIEKQNSKVVEVFYSWHFSTPLSTFHLGPPT